MFVLLEREFKQGKRIFLYRLSSLSSDIEHDMTLRDPMNTITHKILPWPFFIHRFFTTPGFLNIFQIWPSFQNRSGGQGEGTFSAAVDQYQCSGRKKNRQNYFYIRINNKIMFTIYFSTPMATLPSSWQFKVTFHYTVHCQKQMIFLNFGPFLKQAATTPWSACCWSTPRWT